MRSLMQAARAMEPASKNISYFGDVLFQHRGTSGTVVLHASEQTSDCSRPLSSTPAPLVQLRTLNGAVYATT